MFLNFRGFVMELLVFGPFRAFVINLSFSALDQALQQAKLILCDKTLAVDEAAHRNMHLPSMIRVRKAIKMVARSPLGTPIGS